MKKWQIILFWAMLLVFGFAWGISLAFSPMGGLDGSVNTAIVAGAETLSDGTEKESYRRENYAITLCIEGQEFKENACIPQHVRAIAMQYGSWGQCFSSLAESGASPRRILNWAAYPLGDGLMETLASMETPPQSATVLLRADRPVVKPHKDGYTFSPEAVLSAVAACLDGKDAQPIALCFTPAAVTTEMVRARISLMATYTTPYAYNANRLHNLRLACASLNATVIEVGQVFSFNQTVGARTEARGYRPAKIIADGAYTDGVGGGVCQVSTTVYNAAMAAGLGQVEVHRHSLAVKYVAPSRDAMVSEWSDMRFVNDSVAPVYLYAHAKDGKVTVRLYGAPLPAPISLSTDIKVTDGHLDVDEQGRLLEDTQGYTLLRAGQDAVESKLIRRIGDKSTVLRQNAYPKQDAVWRKNTIKSE